MSALPAAAAWRHLGARTGFEVVFIRSEPGGYRFEGHSTAVEEGVPWSVRYAVAVDAGWLTRRAHVVAESMRGTSEVVVERETGGGWLVDGSPDSRLDGCEDVDLEASAFTNAFPVNRLGLTAGGAAEAPAVYLRAPGLEVERLEQSYVRLDDDAGHSRYDYASPAFDFRAILEYDESGLVVDYPAIAVRAL
jgi:hypothetical protein